jgi:FkbM family methyltransferase
MLTKIEAETMLARLAGSLATPLTVVDVGCRWGPAGRWKGVPNLRLFGFDPDPVECEKLNRAAANDPLVKFFPLALGASSERAQLHVAVEPACSSLYPPDPELVSERPGLALISEVGREEVQIETLDRWCDREGVERVDFLKLDTQGSGLDVLRGAERTIASVRVVEVEVEFNPIYLGQPLFPEVDTFLRDRGFVLWRMADLTHYGLPNGVSQFRTTESHYFDHPEPETFHGRGGQLFWANAYYVNRRIAFGSDAGNWQDCLADMVVTAGLGFWDLAAQAAARGMDGVPGEVGEPVRDLVLALAGGDFTAAGSEGTDPASDSTAQPPGGEEDLTSDEPAAQLESETTLRPYEIGEFAIEVGARLGSALADPSRTVARSPLGAVQESYLKPALPQRPAGAASMGSRRVSKTVRLSSGVVFEIVLDPELDDWKTAAYLADEGHMADAALVELVLKLAAPGEVVLDLGAFIGGISLPAAASGCNVIALEPWAHAAALLRASASANRFNNLKVLRTAATEEAGMADYYPAGLHGRIACRGDDPVVAVPTVRIDDLVTELGSPQVRLVRIDVEGAEPGVLEGMTGLLGGGKPPAVLFEADDAALRKMGSGQSQLFTRFEELGYEVYEVGDRTLSLLRPPERAVPPVVDCLAVKGLPPAVPGWKLARGGAKQ